MDLEQELLRVSQKLELFCKDMIKKVFDNLDNVIHGTLYLEFHARHQQAVRRLSELAEAAGSGVHAFRYGGGTSYTPDILCSIVFRKKSKCCNYNPTNKGLVTNKPWTFNASQMWLRKHILPSAKKRDGQFLPNILTADNSSNR